MAEERIRIILKEIHHWKQNKLLPEVYCDFLIALYTKGEGIEEDIKTEEKTPISIYICFLFLVSSLILSFSLIYISSFSTFFTVSSLLLFWFLSLVVFIIVWKKLKHSTYHFLSLLVLLLLAFLNTVYIGTSLFLVPYIAQIVIIVNFIAWLILSVMMRYKWLMFISLLGLTFTFFYIVF